MTTTVTYQSLQAEQAWMVVSDQLQQRNSILSRGIAQLERNPKELPMASRLMILRYHLRISLRKLTSEARKFPQTADDAQRMHQQWMHIQQLFFLLRQIDAELNNAKEESEALRGWLDSLETRIYKSALVHLN
ncbi:hypothetical protein GCM10023189_27970 [Nibrella saemangeumensis]|uniref:Uncharacterized protein n=1 Tax=Nibrella saemangeumensis TaxID=1084526 RepID=A0ABP8MWN4_9BACT